MENDPIKLTEEKILKNKIATDSEIQAIKDLIKAEIEEATLFAEESPLPDPSELYTDNYVDKDYPFMKD